MEKLYKIPLLFFLVASCVGLVLRVLLVFPVQGITFSFLLHGHSHVMFLGWIFNVFFIAYVTQFTDGTQKHFRTIFWMLQVLVVGMLISFPLQGYGLYSIIISTLHTLVVFIFIVLFFKRATGRSEFSVRLAKVSLIFFVISSAGPFFLGYLKANHLDDLNLYRNAIYFYLHFQYNGFFFVGILSLFVKLVENAIPASEVRSLKISCWLFLVAVVPTYALSVLWANPGAVLNFTGAIGAAIQLAGVAMLLKAMANFGANPALRINPEFKFLLRFVMVALLAKACLQLVSAHQTIASWINDYRSIVVGYLHLVLVGIISLFLIGWLIQKGILVQRLGYWGNRLLLTGFIGSELLLFTSPRQIDFLTSTGLQMSVLGLSILMATAAAIYYLGSLSQRAKST